MTARQALCVAGLTALLATAGCDAAGGRTPASGVGKAGDAARRTPVVMFLGDSYTTGRLGQPPDTTYAAETARALGWQVIFGGYRGTGFVAPGQVGKPFATLFQEQLSWRPAPDLLIVSGGHNDWRRSPQIVGAAARQLLMSVRARWPGARLLLMGPLWGGDPKPPVLKIRDALKSVAGELSVPFVDPLAEQWITGDRTVGTGNASRYILPDATHPTAEGTRHIARRFVADLRRLGLARP